MTTYFSQAPHYGTAEIQAINVTVTRPIVSLSVTNSVIHAFSTFSPINVKENIEKEQLGHMIDRDCPI